MSATRARRAALTVFGVLALLAAGACTGSDSSAPSSTAPTAPTTPTTPTTPTRVVEPTTTVTPAPALTPGTVPAELLVIGDSIAGQLYWALQQRSRVREGPQVGYLLTAGPQFAEEWPEPMPQFIDEPADTAVVVSFGVWLATPPEPVADLIDDLTPAQAYAATVDFLRPVAELGAPSATVHLLADIDDPRADARIQAANDQIRAAAAEVGLPVVPMLSGRAGDESATVTIDGMIRPVRNGQDATHFCAAAALVMADQILDDLGVAPRSPTVDDIDDLTEAAAETSYFTTEGCG